MELLRVLFNWSSAAPLCHKCGDAEIYCNCYQSLCKETNEITDTVQLEYRR